MFPCKIYWIFKKPFFTEHFQWLLPNLSGQPMLCDLNWYMLWLCHRYFLVNFEKFLKTLLSTWGGCFFLLQNAKHQHTLSKQHAMGWLFARNIASEATGFYLLEVYLESSQKCQQRNLQSLFSVKLCDNSKIVIVLY